MIKKNCPQSERAVEVKPPKREGLAVEERMKSCFSKKANQEADLRSPVTHDQPADLSRKVKASRKRPSSKPHKPQPEDPKEVGASKASNEDKQGAGEGRTSTSPETDELVKDILQLALEEQVRHDTPSPEDPDLSKDQLVRECSVEELKQIRSLKVIEDCPFINAENAELPRRLLIMDYQGSEIYINGSGGKRSPGKSKLKIPEAIVSAFPDPKKIKNTAGGTFFRGGPRQPGDTAVRNITEETYDTSNPSNSVKYTPNSLTPRSNKSLEPSRQKEQLMEQGSQHSPERYINTEAVYEQYKYPAQQTCYDYYQEYEQFQQKIKMVPMVPLVSSHQNGNRKRRVIPPEELRDYMIDLTKIEADGRTTIMIRNIPNKYSEEMLLELFNRTHKKKYDFFYLPIDFTNSCNMGYAFINFLHTKFIKDFYDRFNGKGWEHFQSEKICNLTYARIQGTPNLVSHFQNSSVMSHRNRRVRPQIDLSESPLIMSSLSTIIERQRQEQDNTE